MRRIVTILTQILRFMAIRFCESCEIAESSVKKLKSAESTHTLIPRAFGRGSYGFAHRKGGGSLNLHFAMDGS
ncbi:hypothetical protein ACWIUD_10500 [Helicobacter sp. 23-1044]